MLHIQVFGGSFFLCDPFELKLQHILSAPGVFAEVTAAVVGSAPERTATGNAETHSIIQGLIDNSLHSLLMGTRLRARGAGAQLLRFLCPCPHRSDVGGRAGTKNEARGMLAESLKTTATIEGTCWMGFGESRLVLQAVETGRAEADDLPAARRLQGLAVSFKGSSLSALPEEVRGPIYVPLHNKTDLRLH